MKTYRFGIVSEGPTDYEVITQVIMKVIPGQHRFFPLQPDLSETSGLGVTIRHSNGWRGVLSWCEVNSSDMTIHQFLDYSGLDILIIQLDADVAREAEINCARPCPIAEDTVIELEHHIKQRLRMDRLDSRIICCIPSDNTEAWVLVALDQDMNYYGEGKYVECVQDPDDIISKPPFKALKRKDGKPKKTQVKYRNELIPVLVDKWDRIRHYCGQANKFHHRLLDVTAVEK